MSRIDIAPEFAGWLTVEFPDDPELRVSYETIYLSLFVQSKGLLNKELTKELRSGRGVRRAGRISVRGQGRGQIADALNISERPAEADDRAVPGHWEGDMVSGSGNTHVGTLVERTSRFVSLVRLKNKTTDCVIAAVTASIQELPEQLKRSLTWDRGTEMAKHKQFTVGDGDGDLLLRSEESLAARDEREHQRADPSVPAAWDELQRHHPTAARRGRDRLNGRPRKTLGYMTPSAMLSEQLQ